MVNGEKLRKMYTSMNEDNIVTTKQLADVKIYSKDINHLIEKGKLKRIKRGRYEVPSFDKLIGNNPEILNEIIVSHSYALGKGGNLEVTINDLNMIAKRYHEIQNGRLVILLDPMGSKERHIIHYIVKAYPDLSSFNILSGDPDKKYVVLKKRNLHDTPNFSDLIKKGNEAYNKNDLDTFFECYHKVLISGPTRPFVYAKLGLAYMKKRKFDNAILYLTLATLTSREEDKKFDFTELIFNLKAKSNTTYKLKEEDIKMFNPEKDYGIDNLVELTRYISDNNLNVTEAWQQLGFNEEQINIIRLLYAKDYYHRGFFEQGDKFYKSYEKSEFKTNKTKKMAEEIRKNRRFYKNRQNDLPLILSLKLKP